MPKRIYVGNWPDTEGATQIEQAFARYGAVDSVSLTRDGRGRFTGEAVVIMSRGAETAIARMNGTTRGGQTINVTETGTR